MKTPIKNYKTSGIWTVDDDGPADFNSIQQAINTVNTGDTIVVFPGIYLENIKINKTLNIISTEGASSTITQSVEVTQNNVVFDGFMVDTPDQYPIHLIDSNNSIIRNNYIWAKSGWTIQLTSSSYNLIDHNILNQTGPLSCKGVSVAYGHSNEISNNLIEPFDPKKIEKIQPPQKIGRKSRFAMLREIKIWQVSLLIVSLVLILVLGGMLISFSKRKIVPRPKQVGINDSVKIHYVEWNAEEVGWYSEGDLMSDNVLWVTVLSRADNPYGLILGLYNNLLGKFEGFESDIIWLDRCIDENLDGIDDITNTPALSYGQSIDLFFNISIMIQFKVITVEKNYS